MKRRLGWVIAIGLVISLFVAGVVSYYASGEPDGLNKVAMDQGFDAGAVNSATSGLPTANYEIAGITSDRLAGGLAGVLGVLVVALLGFGLFRLLGRRSAPRTDPGAEASGA